MAILMKKIKDASVETSAEGVTTLTGKVEEVGITGSITEVAAMPFKINSDGEYVNSSVAATGAIVWGLGLAHVVDYMHVKNGAKPVSPLTGLIAG